MCFQFSYFNLDARAVISVESPHASTAGASSSYSWSLGRAWYQMWGASDFLLKQFIVHMTAGKS